MNPVTGKAETGTEILTIVSNDEHVFEMMGPGPDGKEISQFKIACTRVKDAAPAVKPAAPTTPATKPADKR